EGPRSPVVPPCAGPGAGGAADAGRLVADPTGSAGAGRLRLGRRPSSGGPVGAGTRLGCPGGPAAAPVPCRRDPARGAEPAHRLRDGDRHPAGLVGRHSGLRERPDQRGAGAGRSPADGGGRRRARGDPPRLRLRHDLHRLQVAGDQHRRGDRRLAARLHRRQHGGQHPTGLEQAERAAGAVLRSRSALPPPGRLRPLGEPAGAAPGDPAEGARPAGPAGVHGARGALGDPQPLHRPLTDGDLPARAGGHQGRPRALPWLCRQRLLRLRQRRQHRLPEPGAGPADRVRRQGGRRARRRLL
ncbi:MAG: hypothetical protein AVDCRST_MAG34-311, partial [uncultured Nocardioidaceae bacterium]